VLILAEYGAVGRYSRSLSSRWKPFGDIEAHTLTWSGATAAVALLREAYATQRARAPLRTLTAGGERIVSSVAGAGERRPQAPHAGMVDLRMLIQDYQIVINREEIMKLFVVIMGLATCLIGQASLAQDYPTKTVTIVVPFPAGGGTDTTARALAERLQENLDETFIVENRPGAGSVIGVDYVAKSDADGYTLLLASSSYVTNMVLGDQKPYDPIADFHPIRMLTVVPAVLTTHPDFPADDLRGFLDTVSGASDEYLYASYGERTQPHLVALLLQDQEDFSIRHIPYSGGNPAVTATISGETDIVFPSAVAAHSAITNGQLKALAVAAESRSPALPDVPTFAEQGVDFEIGTWFGVVAPAGTPGEIIAELDSAIEAAIGDEEFRAELERQGAIVVDRGPDAFGTFIEREITRWNNVLERGLLDE
jgi:tripartite-type tricarboxylate transporter receptor subunit TctC